MSFSRFSVLAVFLMMVMSAFVALPTYNVGADEHEGDGPYLNAFPTGSSGDISDYEMSLDDSEGGANITVEATELTDGISYTIIWDIWDATYTYGAEGYWDFSGGSSSASVEYFIGNDTLNDVDFVPGCYMFKGKLFDNDIEIENETWPFTLDVPFSDCEGPDEGDCPFDDVEGSPCEDIATNPCREDHDSDACDDYVTDYCDTHADDPGCAYSADDCPFDDREGTPCEAEECEGAGHDSDACGNYVESYCYLNDDDPGCLFGPGGPGPDFICGNGDVIPFDWVNNGYGDCPDGADEQQYDSDGTRINWFDCHDGSEVWVDQVNDGYEDCPDGDDEGYGGEDYDDMGPSAARIDVRMVDLANWEVHMIATFDSMWSDDMRAGIAGMCAEMTGTDSGEITSECFDDWIDMMENDSGLEHGPGGPDRGCPHDMDDVTCEDFKATCNRDATSQLTCFRMIIDYCEDHDDQMCHEGIMSDDDDDGGKIFKAFFAYEDGEITAAEFMDIFMEDFGRDSDPALYDTYTFTITTEDEGLYSLHPKFGSHSEGSHDFICGNGDTISFKFVNDGYGDCPDGADEQWYDSGTSGDTSDDCQMWNDATCSGDYVNWFDCHDGTMVWIVEVNNGEDNCPYGEDEAYDEDSSSHWYGHVFLYTGNFTDVPDSTENLIGATTHFCDYKDENKTELHCEDVWEGFLEAGDYTIVTAGECWDEWTDEDGDGEYESRGLRCDNHGDYTHVLESGDVVEEYHGTVENVRERDTFWADIAYQLPGQSQTESDQSYARVMAESVFVTDAGSSEWNGEYYRVEDECGGRGDGCRNNYQMQDADGDWTSRHLFTNEGGYWYLDEPNVGTAYRAPAEDGVMTPPVEGWEVHPDSNASSPAPTILVVHPDSKDKEERYNEIKEELGLSDIDDSLVALGYTMDLTNAHWMLMESDRSSFALYDAHAFTVGTGGFNGAIVSAQYQCHDEDDDGEDDECWGADLALYLYEGSFDPEDTYAGLIGANDDNEGGASLDCPGGGGDDDYPICGYSMLEALELSAGDYVVVTAGYDTWSEGFYKNDMVTDDGTIIESWDGKLKGYYWDCCDDDGNETLVEGDERAHMPPSGEFGDEGHFFISLSENATGYQNGTLSADESADNVVSLIHEADAAGLFNEGGDDYDDGDDSHCDDGHCDDSHCEDGHCGGDSHCDDGHCGEEHHCDDGHCDAGDGPHEDECPFTDQETCEELQYLCNDEDDGGNPVMCGWEVAHYCLENEDSGCDEVETACTSPVSTENASICAAYNDFDHDAFHTEYDDDPVTLDGVEGVEEPDDWDDRMIPSSENMVGNLADNEGTSMMMHSSFSITFDSVDDSLASHVFVIPGNSDDDDWEDGDEDPPWKFDFTVAEGYKIDSCTGCDDAEYSDDGRTLSFLFDDDHSTDDVVITFSTAPSVDCDHIIGIDSTGFAFDQMDLAIDVGDTVCWQWTDAADAHNVLELETSFDSDLMTITEESPGNYAVMYEGVELTVTTGFTSGVPSNTVDFRHTFNTDDKTHYYVCVPHASMQMGGRIVVGNGTEDDPVQEAIEESGLPSIGFVVGVLVLVGAAGLRRRIH